MTEVVTGDVIFSYADTLIRAIGFAQSTCYFFPRPEEFGKAGLVWNETGWRVDVNFQRLTLPVSPRESLGKLRPLLPAKYSPVNAKGFGQQKIYLASVSRQLAELIGESLPKPLKLAILGAVDERDQILPEWELRGQSEWEEFEETRIRSNDRLPETTKRALVNARRGQGLFKRNVFRLEHACRITEVENPTHLVASHIKPWRVSSNEERLEGANGLVLTPTIDHLFDRGFISFENNGELIISPVADRLSLNRMGVPPGRSLEVGCFNTDQCHFLEFHRKQVLLRGHSTAPS